MGIHPGWETMHSHYSHLGAINQKTINLSACCCPENPEETRGDHADLHTNTLHHGSTLATKLHTEMLQKKNNSVLREFMLITLPVGSKKKARKTNALFS